MPSVSASNLIVATGDLSTAALLAEAGDGVFVTDVAGLHSGVNPVTGVFSVGASGRVIRDGALAEPIREAGTHLVPVKLHADVEFPVTIEVVGG